MRKDLSTKSLLEYPDVFADAGNVCLFHGEQIIAPESLEPLPQELHYREGHIGLREHRMDVRMRMKENGMELAILHLENQSGISNIMPLRDLGYTYSGYQEQLRRLQDQNRKQGRLYMTEEIGAEQKLHPVVSLVLYYGSDEWTAPTRLKEMLAMPDDDGGEKRDSLVEDHRIHLVDLGRQSEGEVEKYRSDLWYVVKCLQCGKDREKYRRFLSGKEKRKLLHPEAVVDVLWAHAGKTIAGETAERAKKAIREQREKGEEPTMYSIFDFLEEEGLEKGRREGRDEGLREGRNQTYYQMFRNNRTPEDISDFTGESLEHIYNIHEKYLEMVHEKNSYGENDTPWTRKSHGIC